MIDVSLKKFLDKSYIGGTWSFFDDRGDPDSGFATALVLHCEDLSLSLYGVPAPTDPTRCAVAILDNKTLSNAGPATGGIAKIAAALYTGLLNGIDHVIFFSDAHTFFSYNPDLDSTSASVARELGIKVAFIDNCHENNLGDLEKLGGALFTDEDLEKAGFADAKWCSHYPGHKPTFKYTGELLGHAWDDGIRKWITASENVIQLKKVFPNSFTFSTLGLLLDALSFGHLDMSFFNDLAVFKDDRKIYPAVCRYIDFSDAVEYTAPKEIKDARWIKRIWENALIPCGLGFLGRFNTIATDELRGIGEVLGLESYIEAHLEGVPDEDLFFSDEDEYLRNLLKSDGEPRKHWEETDDSEIIF